LVSYQSATTYDPITDLDGGAITDLAGDPITDLSYLTDVQLIISYGITVVNAVNELLSTSPGLVLPSLNVVNALNELPTTEPLLSRISALLVNSASQLQPTEQAYIARAILFALTNALNEQTVDSISNITFEYPLTTASSVNEQIADAITTSAAHSLVTGSGVNEVLDDTAYLAGALAASINDCVQTLSSDSLGMGITANILADSCWNNVTDNLVLINAVYALLLNTATQLQISDNAIAELGEFFITVNDAVQTLPDISPTLAAVFGMLINDSRNLILTDDAYVARALATSLTDALQEISSDNVHFAQAFTLAIQNALNELSSDSPGVTLDHLVALIREVLARGYYFFKAKDKLRR
jgi:hypothetical protein